VPQRSAKMSYQDFRPYLLSLLILFLAVALAFVGSGFFALGAVVIAVICFSQTRKLLQATQMAEQQQRALQEQLGRSERLSAVDEISAGIAHEINNPLGIIAQETQWIQHLLGSNTLKDAKTVGDLRDSLREISIQVDRCKEIVHKLLNLAREMEPVIQGADINDLVENMAALIEREAGTKSIRVLTTLDPDLPIVYSDPPLLRQVVLNLLVNATHAVENDGTITVTTKSNKDDAIEIEVTDTGSGIPAENLNKIFTPFFSTKPQGKGTGLGLAICRGIIERLGGSISVTSDVGKSTTFTIHLPIHRDSEGAK
jgi:two-component system, NtrC family, sensor kinase